MSTRGKIIVIADKEKWKKHYDDTVSRFKREVHRYADLYDKPVKVSMVRAYINHDLKVLGLRMSDFLDRIDKEGHLYIQPLPKRGDRVILTEDVKELGEALDPENPKAGLVTFLSKYEKGELDYE